MQYLHFCLCSSPVFLLTQSILKLLMTGKESPKAGVMIPIPQYPLYTATIAEYNAHLVCITLTSRC